MAYERFLDKTKIPGEDAVLTALGSAKALWLDIHTYIQEHYDFTPDTVFFTKQCGWSARYRKGKKTLCYLFPETGAFSALIVLGKAEAARADGMKDRLNEAVQRVLETTEQLHDGRWLWIRATEASDVRSLKVLLSAKRRQNAPGIS
jgi:hypothetical protein